MRQPPCLDVRKSSEYASAECKVNYLARFCSLCLFHVYFILLYVYFAISVQLDFHSKP